MRPWGRRDGNDNDDLETLKAIYERVIVERDRLRDARGFFARPLGAASASAGVSTALVAAIGSHIDTLFIWLATGTVGLIVLCGVAYDRMPAYRHLLARALASSEESSPARALIADRSAEVPALDPWYRAMIALELKLIGEPQCKNRLRLPRAKAVKSLQDGLDAERTGLRAIQVLWVLVIVFLVLAKLA